MEEVQKKNTFKKFVVAGALSFCVLGIGATIVTTQYQKPQIARAVEYNDNSYQIVFNANELNNYTFTNLGEYINNLESYTYFNQTELDYTYNNLLLELAHTEFIVDDGVYYAYNYNDYNYSCNFNLLSFKFDFGVEDGDGQFTAPSFDNDLIWILNSTIYTNIKNAVELDIQANQPTPLNPVGFLGQAIQLIVGGITGVAGGIGTGLSTLVTDLAYNTAGTGMSSFMSIVFIFGGISLAFALSRWVVNLLASFGNRNR